MSKTLYIFDFDDTLVRSDAQVEVLHKSGNTSSLNSAEFAKYTPQQGDEFNFSEFEISPIEGELILPVFKRLQSVLQNEGLTYVSILSARENPVPIRKFLTSHGIPKNIAIGTVGSADPEAKGQFIKKKLRSGIFEHVHVFEDNAKNLVSIKNACDDTGVGFSHTLVVSGR
jgi:hypothetical protein